MPTQTESSFQNSFPQLEAAGDLSGVTSHADLPLHDPALPRPHIVADHGLAIHTAHDKLCPADIGKRLVYLAPTMRLLAGNRIMLMADIAVPNAMVRMAKADFDAAILALVTDAVTAGATNISVRNRMAGTRAWILVSDDGRTGMRIGGLSCASHFARTAHGHMRVRRGAAGSSVGLILPTVLSILPR